MSTFRYQEDKLPCAIICGVFLVDILIYLLCQNLWLVALWTLLTTVPKCCTGAWNHHHQHLNFFYNSFLNRCLEFILTVQTGMTTHSWTLHHVLGHHLNYLDQEKDESRWKDLTGQTMGALRYTLETALTAYPRAWKVGSKYPKYRKSMLFMGVLALAFLGLVLWWRPLAGFLVFVVPMLYTFIHTCYATYDHHAGLDTEDHSHASYNIRHKWYNILTGNLGFHTAHHVKPGLHWSRLPELHKKLEKDIPEELYRTPKMLMRFLPSK